MDGKVIFDNNQNDNTDKNNEVNESQIKNVVEIRTESTNYEEILNLPIINLIKRYREDLLEKKKEITPIHVDEIASKIARLYELVRKIVDWKEENVLRRSAILRILKRSLISKVSNLTLASSLDTLLVADSLVKELIRGGHLPNDEIPEEKIGEVAKILSKYLYVLENAPIPQNLVEFPLKKRVNFYNWLLEIAACEIEDILSPPLKENNLIRVMTHLMDERIKIVPEEALRKEEKSRQIYIATCRTLFDLDDALISYHILKYQYPEWLSPQKEFLADFTKNIFSVISFIQSSLKHPLSKEFFNISERIDTVFTLIGDVLEEYKTKPEELTNLFIDKEKFKEKISNFYDKRFKTLKTRLFRLAIFSALSVFASNWFTYFLVEIPLAHLFYGRFNLFATIVDFLLPTLAMFLLVIIIKPPPPENLNEVIKLTFKFVYKGEKIDLYEIKAKKKRRWLSRLIISLIYIITCVFSFFGIGFILYKATLPMTSVILDTLIMGVEIFAALVIRNKARELTVLEKTSFWEFILDVLSVPVAEVGSFLAAKWKEYNVFTIFFNFFIEMPFVSFVEFIESWSTFLKEKKAEIH